MGATTVQRARLDEVAAIARLYRRTANASWDFLLPHTPAEDLAFFTAAFQAGPILLAESDGSIVGFCAARRGWIDHLYVDPARHGEGIGQALLQAALKGRSRVRLWTFQRNDRSRAFYARQGLLEVRLTDGAHNEEKEPDVLMEWRRPEP